MNDSTSARLVRIIRYEEKGGKGTPLEKAELLQDFGLVGDFHGGQGEKKISLLPLKVREYLNSQRAEGLCFARFKENLTFEGELPKGLKVGDLLSVGEAELIVTSVTKRCFEECPLFQEGRNCMLASQGIFAKVAKGGVIHVGDVFGGLNGMGQEFTHFDGKGNAIMVDVSGKAITERVALAKGIIKMSETAFKAVSGGTAAKGDVLGVARVAGIMAVKKTSELIPMCHPLAIDKCTLDFELSPEGFQIEALCVVKVSGRTGVEMEAMTGVSVALLTIYDMCKAMDRAMEIGEIRLVEKSGGKSGHFVQG